MKKLAWILSTGWLVIGCGGSGTPGLPGSQASDARLVYHSDGQGPLRLETQPNGNRYPNPKNLTEMVAIFHLDGTMDVACRALEAASSCSDVPAFLHLDRQDGRVCMRVVDIYGLEVLNRCPEAGATSAPGVVVASRGTGGDGTVPVTRGAGGDGTAPRSQGGNPIEQRPPPPPASTQPSRSTSHSEGGTNPCAATLAQKKREFCEAVLENLRKLNPSYTFDCAVLDRDDSSMPGWDITTRVSCVQLVDPPYLKLLEAGLTDHCGVLEAANEWKNNARKDLLARRICGFSPLVLDLGGNGVHLGSLEQGVAFDLLGTGEAVQCSWIEGDDALLVLDRNGNGTIDGAAELFGNATGGRAFPHGFAALAELDENGDGRVDGRDPAFDRLRVWQDQNHDGRSSPDEIESLTRLGIDALETTPSWISGDASSDGHGNQIPLTSHFVRHGGRPYLLVDAFLRFDTLTPPEEAFLRQVKTAALVPPSTP